jgi:acyl-CoA synthetase (AMP-forming)/AMP-acid ligase II
MILRDFLSRFEPHGAVVVSQDGRELEASEIKATSSLRVPLVSVSTRDPLSAIHLLFAADGSAAEITVGFERDTTSPANTSVTKTHWVLRTSGTTGKPKEVTHTLATLMPKNAHEHRGEIGSRWALLYPWDRFAGLQVILHAIVAGGSVLAVDRTKPLSEQVAFLIKAGCTHISATPTLWRLLLAAGDIRTLPLQQITLGGEIVDQAILDSLRLTFPDTRITHVYASTEAGSSFAVSDGLAGFSDVLVMEPKEVRGVDVRDGELFIYNPAASGLQKHDSTKMRNSWIATGDFVSHVGTRYQFVGRRDSIVNVGGSKFRAEELEQFALQLDGVAAAVVKTRPNPILGTLVTLEIVPTANCDREVLPRHVLHSCKQELPRYMTPGRVVLVDAVTIATSGKVQR